MQQHTTTKTTTIYKKKTYPNKKIAKNNIQPQKQRHTTTKITYNGKTCIHNNNKQTYKNK